MEIKAKCNLCSYEKIKGKYIYNAIFVYPYTIKDNITEEVFDITSMINIFGLEKPCSIGKEYTITFSTKSFGIVNAETGICSNPIECYMDEISTISEVAISNIEAYMSNKHRTSNPIYTEVGISCFPTKEWDLPLEPNPETKIFVAVR